MPQLCFSSCITLKEINSYEIMCMFTLQLKFRQIYYSTWVKFPLSEIYLVEIEVNNCKEIESILSIFLNTLTNFKIKRMLNKTELSCQFSGYKYYFHFYKCSWDNFALVIAQ